MLQELTASALEILKENNRNDCGEQRKERRYQSTQIQHTTQKMPEHGKEKSGTKLMAKTREGEKHSPKPTPQTSENMPSEEENTWTVVVIINLRTHE